MSYCSQINTFQVSMLIMQIAQFTKGCRETTYLAFAEKSQGSEDLIYIHTRLGIQSQFANVCEVSTILLTSIIIFTRFITQKENKEVYTIENQQTCHLTTI